MLIRTSLLIVAVASWIAAAEAQSQVSRCTAEAYEETLGSVLFVSDDIPGQIDNESVTRAFAAYLVQRYRVRSDTPGYPPGWTGLINVGCDSRPLGAPVDFSEYLRGLGGARLVETGWGGSASAGTARQGAQGTGGDSRYRMANTDNCLGNRWEGNVFFVTNRCDFPINYNFCWVGAERGTGFTCGARGGLGAWHVRANDRATTAGSRTGVIYILGCEQPGTLRNVRFEGGRLRADSCD